MPARRIINLLPQDAFASSYVGKFLIFSITIGRYIVVFTELIVILAFLSRFFIDRQISDLNDRIKEQVGVINASREFETNFRFTQARLAAAKTLLGNQFGATSFLDKITPLISADITITRLSLQDGALALSGSSLSVDGLRQTIANFQSSSWLTDVSLTSISTGASSGGTIKFSLSATLRQKSFAKEALP